MNGKYERIRKIGSGSFGEVFEVRDTEKGQQYAIKKMSIYKEVQSIADNEIKSLSKMNHPNILRIHEYFYENDQNGELCLFMVLEYCRNEDLLAYFAKNRKTLPSIEKEAIRIFKQIVNGCIALHEKGIIHRDLKPENVLLNGNVVKIADFGCAKITENQLKGSKMTYNIGTPIYSAPEVVNEGKYDQRCDIWSAGIILYFMIYGTVPFLEKNILKLKSLVESKTKEVDLELPNYPEISPEVGAVLKGMIRYNQEQRLVWGEITGSRLFHSPMSDIEGYVSYLLQVNKVLAWLLQSLVSFSEFYSFNRLSKLTVTYNYFMECNLDFTRKILHKAGEAKGYFRDNKLRDHHFSQEICQSVTEAGSKLTHYLQVMGHKFKDTSMVSPQRSGRYHLWCAEEEARAMASKTSVVNQSSAQKRSVYCLLVLGSFDRFLGEQHYLSLESHEFIEGIKQLSAGELSARISKQMERII